MKGYIYETLNAVNKDKMVVKENGDFMTLEGVFGVCGVRNNNQRVYQLSNYKKMVDEMCNRMQSEKILGELEHPNSMNITLENVSHIIESISIDENTGVVSGKIKLLNTPKGKIAQEIVKGGADLFISSRAMGDVDAQGNVTLEMLKTYDLVGTPGFSQARLHLNESLEGAHTLCESMLFVSEQEGNKNEINNMTEKVNEETENKYEGAFQAMSDRLQVLESEIERLKESNSETTSKRELCEAVEDWANDTFAEKLKKEIVAELTEQFTDKLANISEGVQNWFINEVAPAIQAWVCEEYSQGVQNWIFKDYSPAVQQWITEHYSPVVEKWMNQEFAGAMKEWMSTEFAGGIEKWLTEEHDPAMKNDIMKEAPKLKMESTLNTVDAMLKQLDESANEPAKKKVFESAVNADANEPLFIAKMPADVRVKWNMASAEVKDMITRKARIYNFANESAIEDFWKDQNFTMVTENKNSDLDKIADPWERNMRAALRKRF